MSRQRATERLEVRKQDVTKTGSATKHSAVGKFGQIINIGAGFGSANRIKPFQRKAQCIHSDVAAGAIWVGSMHLHLFPQRHPFHLSIGRQSIDSWRGWWRRRVKQTGEHPFATLDRTGASWVAGGHQN